MSDNLIKSAEYSQMMSPSGLLQQWIPQCMLLFWDNQSLCKWWSSTIKLITDSDEDSLKPECKNDICIS